MAGDVDGDNLGQAEIPLEVGHDKGRDKATGSSVDVDGTVNVFGDQQVVDGLCILIVAGVRGSEDRHDTNGVFIHQRHGRLGVNDEALPRAVDVLFVNLKVARRLFPADLNGRRHDDVGVLGRLAGGLAALLPAALHGEDGEHDGLGGADGGGADGVAVVGGVEEVGNHVDAAVLDVGGIGVLFVVDEVGGEGVGHELEGFFFLFPASQYERMQEERRRGAHHVSRDERSQARNDWGVSIAE